jgi:hypothetical protein
MFLAGIQASSDWTPDLKHSGVTSLGEISHQGILMQQLAAG